MSVTRREVSTSSVSCIGSSSGATLSPRRRGNQHRSIAGHRLPSGRASIASGRSNRTRSRMFNAPASIVSPRLRRLLLVVLLLLAAASVYGGWRLYRLAPIGSAYAAKILCSGVFVAGRQPASVIAEDILADNTWLLRLVRAQVDLRQPPYIGHVSGLRPPRRTVPPRPGLHAGDRRAVCSPDPEVGVSPNPGPQQSPLPLSAGGSGDRRDGAGSSPRLGLCRAGSATAAPHPRGSRRAPRRDRG